MARILVVSSSLFGANADLAALIRPVLAGLGAEYRLRGVKQLVLAGQMAPGARAIMARGDDLAWADGFIFSSPAHTGLLSAAMKAFIDEHHDAAETGAFIDKTFTAMATGAYLHAGQEHVVAELNAVAAIWGCVLVPPSGADAVINHLNGNPWGLSFTLHHGRVDNRAAAEKAVRSHLTRFVAVTDALAATRREHPPGREPATSGGKNRKERKAVPSATHPLRATDVFVGPHETPRTPSRSSGSARSSGSSGPSSSPGGHSPTNPLRAADVFRGPQDSGAGSGVSGGGSGAGGGSSPGSGHSPTNPLRATDVFRGPYQSRH